MLIPDPYEDPFNEARTYLTAQHRRHRHKNSNKMKPKVKDDDQPPF